jgi:CheY-like chemotaxis protein
MRSSAPANPESSSWDDDRGVLDLLATFLDLAGFDVTTAIDGAEALRIAARGFDAITTDLAMPRMDGCEFIEVVRVAGFTAPGSPYS